MLYNLSIWESVVKKTKKLDRGTIEFYFGAGIAQSVWMGATTSLHSNTIQKTTI
jgi:hypothetical protein